MWRFYSIEVIHSLAIPKKHKMSQRCFSPKKLRETIGILRVFNDFRGL